MPHTFKLDTPSDLTATLERLKDKLSAAGGKLTGDEKEGHISVKGVEGLYKVCTDAINITITKKPISTFPNTLIERQIRSIFQEIS